MPEGETLPEDVINLELAEHCHISFFEARNLTDFDRARLITILNEKAGGQKLRAEIDNHMNGGK